MHYSPPSVLLLCIYPVQHIYTFFLHIPAYILFIKSTVYCPAQFILLYILINFLFLFFTWYLYLCILFCVCVTYNCTVHGADLTYILLLVIFCIIVYVMNKYNFESWTTGLSETVINCISHYQQLEKCLNKRCILWNSDRWVSLPPACPSLYCSYSEQSPMHTNMTAECKLCDVSR